MQLHRLSALGAVLALLPVATRAADEAKGFAPDAKWIYKQAGGAALELHAFLPPGHKADDRRPAIVFFFGGGWNGGAPSQFYPHCAYFASRGMVALAADYRVKNRHQTTPRECVMDGKSALRWLRAHAHEHGIDPARIAAGGGSAGGHVAAAVATVPGLDDPADDRRLDCRPGALVLFNPVFDNGPGGWGHDRVKEYWREISPLHNVGRRTPPAIVFSGSEDKLVPPATVEKFKRAIEEQGLRCETHIYVGQGHGFFNYRVPEYYTKTVIAADRFLASLGYLAGEPTMTEGTPHLPPAGAAK